MIIDATDLIVGRLSTQVAKKALLGEKIDIINAEKAVISGRKLKIMEDFKQMNNRGAALTGPVVHRRADKLLRRIIRGMLPYKQEKGRIAYANVMCYVGHPPEFAGMKTETFENAHLKKLPNVKFMTLGEVSKYLGGRQ